MACKPCLKILGVVLIIITIVTFLLFIFTVISWVTLWVVLIPMFILSKFIIPKLKESQKVSQK